MVTLTAINENGTGKKSEYIRVDPEYPPPSTADFDSIIDDTNPLSVQFMDHSYASGLDTLWSWNWDFGDGEYSNEQNPLHTYQSPGNYTVTLRVAGEWSSGETSRLISVRYLKAPIANFYTSPISGVEPLTVKFTDKSTVTTASWYWDFGDGANSTEQNPTHTYSSAGDYTVNLTVTNENGVNSKYSTITVPTAAPIYYSGNGHYYEVISVPGITWEDAKNAAQSLSFSGMNGHLATITSQDENDFIINNIADDNCWWLGGFQPDDTPDSMEPDGNWHWVTEEKWDYTNWPIGRPDNAFRGQNRLALWSEKNWDDASSNDRDHIIGYFVEYEEQRLPEANFSTNVTTGEVPLSVLFTDLSENATQWNWDFGDGNTSTEQNPVHSYLLAGNYTVTLTVTGEQTQNTVSKIISIQGSNASVANFSASPICGKAPLKVAFTDKSTGSPAAWKWCFGDGTSSTDKNPVHTFCKAGEYNVTLIVSNTEGSNKVTKSEYIRVLK